MTTRLLAIDTATEACSAALLIDNELIERFEIAPRRHTQLILPMIDSLLKEAGITLHELDAIAFGRGPGAFTGVRIASSVTQGLAFSLNLPVLPVSSLAALAWGCWRERGQTSILTAIDARMKEVYWGGYQLVSGRMEAVIPEEVCIPEGIKVPDGDDWFGCGTGWASYGLRLQRQLARPMAGWIGGCYPQARDIAILGWHDWLDGKGCPPEQALPVYLRDQVANPPATRAIPIVGD